jgi:succinate dehydrogenase / fumarate reductase flavoprotein subunit
LSTTIPGLFCLGEANFSDHGANRLGASALMQGLADGYFVLPTTIGDYLAGADGDRTADSFHREIGELLWEHCGMSRSAAGLRKALERMPALREEFWRRVKVPGGEAGFNQSLERANRVVDYLELAELMCLDALHRTESCGAHFREESQTPDGEAARRDEEFCYAAAWEFTGTGQAPVLHREDLVFEYVHPTQRSYA